MSYYDIQGNLVNKNKSIEKFSDIEINQYQNDINYAKTTCNSKCETPDFNIGGEGKKCFPKYYFDNYNQFDESLKDLADQGEDISCNINVPKNINKGNFQTLTMEENLNNKIVEERELQLKNRTNKLEPINDTFANTNDPFYAKRLEEFFVLLENEKDKVLDATVNFDVTNNEKRMKYHKYIVDVCHSYLKGLEDYGTSQKNDIQNIIREVYLVMKKKIKVHLLVIL